MKHNINNNKKPFVRREVTKIDTDGGIYYYIAKEEGGTTHGLCMFKNEKEFLCVFEILNNGSLSREFYVNKFVPADIQYFTCTAEEKNLLKERYNDAKSYYKYVSILENKYNQTDSERKYFRYRGIVSKVASWLVGVRGKSEKELTMYIELEKELGRNEFDINYLTFTELKVLHVSVPRPFFPFLFHKYRYLWTDKLVEKLEKYNDKRTRVPLLFKA